MRRLDGRAKDELRHIQIQANYVEYPEGSVLVSIGNTRVLCNASIDEKIPKWMRDSGKQGGWITAEYGMLPRSTHTRTPRETNGLRGRTQEIRRLIGRSLRAAVDLDLLGERTCIVDCDVLQADGGTRTAAITGGYLAIALAFNKLHSEGLLRQSPLISPIAAISVGILANQVILDLSYEEDFKAEVDSNIVMNGEGQFVEIQGTAEGEAFSYEMLSEMLSMAQKGITDLIEIQKKFLATN